ncbi:MAG TPA: 7-cyano-7-deazaguanine synthase [Candidatus Methanofastidiosa archaeon]|nr:7-cyano-7-deazaguanine synthase [Candidatus Methanofastidiosa archaeon]HPR41513.1 7-cyano-7-deazaguanine synthase [Candidatus Methanofastidiosa archaeon]
MKKAVVLLSDGIDSPVACHMALDWGYEVIALTFDNYPFTSPVNLELAKKLLMRIAEERDIIIKYYIVKNGQNLRNIIDSLSDRSRSYTCVICKRSMIKLANEVADIEGAEVIVTGENLGQVASQTLDNMIVISKASKRHIVRPLLCMDKLEIEKVAKDIGTYEISIQSKSGCGAVPKYPQTRADRLKVEELENDIELIMDLD